MKSLVVDDDFTSRRILQKYLSKYGECNVAINGNEAIEQFKAALGEKSPYDLICMDIMMPGVCGHEALILIREIEQEAGIFGKEMVKIIMTTALSDATNMIQSFKEQSEAYMVKPIENEKLTKMLEYLELI